MKTHSIRSLGGPMILASLLIMIVPENAISQVVINEVSAVASERLVRFDENGAPHIGAGTDWSELDFDDSKWDIGTAPFGFGRGEITTDVGDEMIGNASSLYLRKTFTVSAENAAKEEPFRFSGKVDDGFVAYVNGHEIARANLSEKHGPIFYDHSTFGQNPEWDKKITYESDVLASDVLQEGENVFAVQVINRVINVIEENSSNIDRTLRFDGDLFIGLGIFKGGSNISIPLEDENWKFRVGHGQPSGGMVDFSLVGRPEFDPGFVDWIELANQGNEAVDLEGWTLTDDDDVSDLWTFPAGVSIPAGGHLVVIADGADLTDADYLHTNFKVSGTEGYLGLYDGDGNVVSEMADGLPRQSPFHTYGRSVEGDELVYFSEPSPGNANSGPEFSDFSKGPKFDPPGGFHTGNVEVTLFSNTEEATIRYTVDGTDPTLTNGIDYEGPISVEPIDEQTGTVIRARAFKDGLIDSTIKSQTYLVDVDEVFKEIPIISVAARGDYAFYKPHGVMAVEGGASVGEAWRSTGVEDYYMPFMHGRPYERQVSMEFIYPETEDNVQIDAGIRLAASSWSRPRFALRSTDRSPWQSAPAEKPSFNVFFRGDYGNNEMNYPLIQNFPVRTFSQLRMRAGKNDIRNPWIVDELSRRVLFDTGQFGSVGIQNALFVNGVYKGYFNTVARLREELLQEYYGRNEPWDVLHIHDWADGDGTEWAKFRDLLREDLTDLDNYQEVLKVADPVNIADYFIVNTYGATWDWPHNNFVVAKERSEFGRWRMYMWDAEGTFGNRGGRPLSYDSFRSDLNNGTAELPSVYRAMVTSPEFRLVFADRLQKHFFTPGGALTPDNMKAHVENLANEINALMSFSSNGTVNVNPINAWIDGRERVLFSTAKQYEDNDLWGGVQVPNISPHGGEHPPGTETRLTAGSLFNPQKGDIYYTTDGSDPRLLGGEINPDAILYDRDTNQPIIIDRSMTVKARVRTTSLFVPQGTWGAVNEAVFLIGVTPANAENLVITELMVDPAAPSESEVEAGFSTSDFEYVELFNKADMPIDLGGLIFVEGIGHEFPADSTTILQPGAYGLIVRNADAFQMRYGTGLPVIGDFGKKLSNGGELLEVVNQDFEPVIQLTYGIGEPWPNATDTGNSLVLKDTELDPNDPASWTASAAINGSPGTAEGDVQPPVGNAYTAWVEANFEEADRTDSAVSGMMADPDSDGSNNLVEFASGTHPRNPHSEPAITMTRDGASVHLVSRQRTGVTNLAFQLEQSSDLSAWEDAAANTAEEISSADLGANISEITHRITVGSQARYLRWRVDWNP
ncbi:MAG: lamin tail domain-containing protein [Verrucomicrobiota bacterium]